MKTTGIKTAVILMALSMLLLLLFQGYWLRQLYKEERRNLHRVADVLLRETMIGEQLRHLYVDSNFRRSSGADDARKGAFSMFSRRVIAVDDSATVGMGDEVVGKVPRITVSLSADSSQRGRRNGVTIGQQRLWLNKSDRGREGQTELRFSFSMPGSAISLKSVDSAYGLALAEAGIYLKYTITAAKQHTAPGMQGGMPPPMVRIDGVSTPLQMNTFEVQLLNAEWWLLRKLLLPVLFAVFMTALISTAFWLLFKNIKAQQRMALLKNDFMSNISHELKTPIATVGVALEALKSFDALQSPERTQEYLNIGQNELQRLGLLVDKVLKMSLFQQKQMAMQYEEVDMKLLTEAVIASMRLLLEKANARVRFDAEGGDFVLKGDATHLKSVLYNLLDNALKYSPDNPEIGVRLTATAHSLEWTVTDSGIGIPAMYHSKVFEKFFRVPQGNTHRVKGYGLGLSYVAAVVKQHGGVIAVATNPGGGSIFTVHFHRTELPIT
jgi:two-component system phosphate regulon sensor histidine kinase PhoR